MQRAMGALSVLSAAMGVVSLCAALLHLGLDRVSGRREHLWLGVAALGIVQLAIGNAMAYEADTAAAALRAQALALTCAAPVVIGFLRFTSHVTGARILPLELFCGTLVTGATVGVLIAPELFFAEPVQVTRIDALGVEFVRVQMTAWTTLLLPPLLANYVIVTCLFWKHRNQFEDPLWIVGSVGVWTLTTLNDTAVGFGLYDGPFLVVFGYLFFLSTFTVLLVRRFVGSLDRMEATNEELQRVVDERTLDLRNKDLQVAHGARMATVGTLSAGLAREIQQPLREVSARIDDVAHDFGLLGSSGEIEARVADARAGIERIRSIVSELLHVARRDGGEFGAVNLNRVIENVLPIVRHEARDRTRLTTELGDIPTVEGDERLLGQILLNLVLNAIQAIPEDGTADAHHVVVGTEAALPNVRLVVQDTGPGIPDEVRDHVFEPFFSTKSPSEAVGLGLAVTRQLVERHRGTIAIESSPKGTRLVVELPSSDEVAP